MGITATTASLPVAPIDLASLARLPLEQRAGLPATGGVYLAVDNATRVWYVGLAESLRDRLATHDRLQEFREKSATAVLWITESSEAKRAELERKLIDYFHPPLNNRLNFNSLPAIDLGLSPDEEVDLFLQVRHELKRLELLVEHLKPNIVTRCQQSSDSRIVHPLGTIRVQSYKTWDFSEEVESLKTNLSKLQKDEKENGKAKVRSESDSPVVQLNASELAGRLGFAPHEAA